MNVTKKRLPPCKICQSPDVDKINRDMVIHGLSGAEMEKKYSYRATLLNKHRDHISRNLSLAHERKERDAADQLLSDVEKLWSESCDFLDVSKSAVKTQAVTEWVEEDILMNGQPILDDDGNKITKMVQKTVYKEYRDLGATATALRVAQENRRLFGDVTGAIHPPQERSGPGIVLHIVIPGMPKQEVKRQIVDTTAEEI